MWMPTRLSDTDRERAAPGEQKMKTNAIRVDPEDNVVVAFRAIKAGESVVCDTGLDLKANEDIMKNHKVAVLDIPEHSPVIKYGEIIGFATKPIRAGDWVHTHNLRSEESE
jgi:altronate hydrolase